jgi:hypothetical protein
MRNALESLIRFSAKDSLFMAVIVPTVTIVAMMLLGYGTAPLFTGYGYVTAITYLTVGPVFLSGVFLMSISGIPERRKRRNARHKKFGY